MSIIPRSVAKRTAESIWVMLSAERHTSRVIGCFAENPPEDDTSNAQTPSSVKA